MAETACPSCGQPLLLDATTGPAGPTFCCRACRAPVDPLAVLASDQSARPRNRERRLLVISGVMIGGLAALVLMFLVLATVLGR